MPNERDQEIRTIKSTYDLATLFRVLPWVFLIGDKRGPQVLVPAAFDDARGFIESHVADSTRDRKSLMRGLAMLWFQSLGIPFDSTHIEIVVELIARTVDERVLEYNDVIDGDRA